MSSLYHESELSNGWPLVTAHLPHSESCSLGILVPVGSLQEQAGEEGIAHFIEHMLFKGTEQRSARDISAAIEGEGGTLNAWTTEDHTFYEARGPEDLIDTMIDVLGDMFFQSTLPADEIERERGVICEEIVMYQESPGDHINDLISESIWPDHPLGKAITGTAESVGAISREQMRGFIDKNYYSNKTLFAVAGPHDHDSVAKRWERVCGDHKANAHTPKIQDTQSSVFTPKTIVEESDIEQVHLGVSFLCDGRLSQSRHALRVLSTLLGETMSSRLFQRLREEAGVCYQIQTDLSLFHSTGSLSISAGLDAEELQSSLELLAAEIKDLHDSGPTNDEVERAKRFIIGQHRISFETSASQLSWISESYFAHQQIIDPNETRDAIQAVTTRDVHDIIRATFDPKKIALAAIGPISKSDLTFSW